MDVATSGDGRGDDLAEAREGVVVQVRLGQWLDVAFPSRIGRVVALSQIVQRGAI